MLRTFTERLSGGLSESFSSTMGTEEPHSLECIHKSELFPKKSIVLEDDALQVPFPTMNGEYVTYLGRTSDGVIALSNFRLFVRQKNVFVNVPLGLIDTVDTREIFYLTVYCKDATTVRCAFSTNEQCQQWYKRLLDAIAAPKEVNDLFALAYHAWRENDTPTSDTAPSRTELEDNTMDHYTFGKDVDRMQFDTNQKKAWRISLINENFGLTSSYSKYHIVPAAIGDEELKSVASFRALKRFPSVVWRDQRNGAVLVRCSQPELGWLGWRNTEDEVLLGAIPKACALNPGTDVKKTTSDGGTDAEVQTAVTPKKMLLIDCRSYGAAFANRAKGGGCESADYYPTCEIQFMNLANIHTIRKSFIALRTLCSTHPDPASWLSSLEHTKWLQYNSSLLRAATLVVNAIDKEARPVLVHCSDGWDRTPQIVSLAEVLLDPHYRTIKGFHALIEREWLDFGHKFADRCGHSTDCDDPNERSPIFLQWLDCVFQVYRKFPCAFEFNEAFLVKLVQHTYSRLFGTFLCNNARERQVNKISEKTESVWTLLLNNDKFVNLLYNPHSDPHVLYPDYGMHQLELWKSIYLSKNSLETSPDILDECLKTSDSDMTPDQEAPGLQKTRSCESLNKLGEHPSIPGRRMSDPNIIHGSPDTAMLLAKEVDSSHVTGSEKDESDEDETVMENGHVEMDLIQNGIVENGLSDGVESDGLCDNESETSDSDIERCMEETGVPISQDNTEEESSESTLQNGLINGHISEEEVSEDALNCNDLPVDSEGHNNDRQPTQRGTIDIMSKKLSERTLRSVESSTDTITDLSDNGERKQSHGTVNGYANNCHEGEGEDVNGVADEEEAASKDYLKHQNTSISTSTTDISDSNVHSAFGEKRSISRDLRQLSHCIPMRLNCNNVMCSRQDKTSASPSPSTSPFPTPVSSRTPNSTCPPTPGTGDGKMSESPLSRHYNGLGRHLDKDGLTTFVDPVQQRMYQLESEYKRRVQILEIQLAAARKILQQNGCSNGNGRTYPDYRDDIASLPESTEGGDFHSLGNVSNPASDVSWEQVDDGESKMTLWVPDHAVTHCAGCDYAFSLVRRKHHCRSCGRIYCNTCSNYFSPVPRQHLEEAVRVCRSCHIMLQPAIAAANLASAGATTHHSCLTEDKRVPILVPE
ncbi:phosphatidylinositol-3,5-bisphosphate 3-phosphatase MTMR3-like isoform X1 [Haliotis cracherodii]|uniref:phosphatidylinositol-3,5-bisphosphate 3-phosphatase MTMR3-like isoform X1 n=2 Tax=Haliotis cracherodii TaxID=6455 RepID=UPI0039E90CD4